MNQPILSKSDFVLVPTVKKEISYIWELLSQWDSGSMWKSMFDDYDHFHADLERTLKEDMVWTCWTKNGKASQKFGIILLTDIAYGLSAEIHGAVDKTFLREKRKHSIIDKTTREVIKFAFNDLGVARINATFYEKNPLVLGFLKRHGFKRNAILKKSVYIGEEIRDTFIYGLIEDDFLKENKNVKET